MIVFLWDACGPACRRLGVTDNEARARKAAEACLVNGHAWSARVEAALAVLGTETLTSGYRRTGQGWTGARQGGRVMWTPLELAS